MLSRIWRATLGVVDPRCPMHSMEVRLNFPNSVQCFGGPRQVNRKRWHSSETRMSREAMCAIVLPTFLQRRGGAEARVCWRLGDRPNESPAPADGAVVASAIKPLARRDDACRSLSGWHLRADRRAEAESRSRTSVLGSPCAPANPWERRCRYLGVCSGARGPRCPGMVVGRIRQGGYQDQDRFVVGRFRNR